MAKAGVGISGLSVGAIAVGGLLVYSGIVDAPVLDALRDILQGRTPQGRAPVVTDVARGIASGAVGGAGGGKAVGRASKLTRLAGAIGDGFGAARPNGRKHKGIDIPAQSGTPIPAAASGTVKNTGYEPGGAGNFVNIDHGGGLVTKYFHLSKILVSRGQKVIDGQTIGLVGSTGNSSGPHLHFEVWDGGQARDPMGYI
jgi:murein DD-endopeptidase MepM/ murein hydrolase activator NlpD